MAVRIEAAGYRPAHTICKPYFMDGEGIAEVDKH
jgi:hypothetical protein